MSKPVFFCELEKYELDRYPTISIFLNNEQDLWTVTGNIFQFNMTGILIIDNTPVVVFPKNFSIPDDERDAKDCASDLVRVLLRYRNEPFHESYENSLLYGSNEYQCGQISSALQLIDDYKQYGYISRDTGVLTTTQKGRIDWPATINRTSPVFSHGQPAYFNPLMRYEKTDTRNAVHLIHRYIICDCCISWGWLFGDKITVDNAAPVFSTDEAITLLYRELKETYIQREVSVIKLMIDYLNSTTGTDRNEKLTVLATRYFSFVWEAVCGYLFYNQYPTLRSIVPQPEWESTSYKGKISQRPDIITLGGSVLYILDAKYYNIKNNLPGWHDVVKQLFYRHTIKNALTLKHNQKLLPETREVYNAFLFPGNNSSPLEYAGRVLVKETVDLGEIIAFTIDQRKAFHTYAYRDDDAYRSQLKCALEKTAM